MDFQSFFLIVFLVCIIIVIFRSLGTAPPGKDLPVKSTNAIKDSVAIAEKTLFEKVQSNQRKMLEIHKENYRQICKEDSSFMKRYPTFQPY